MTRTFKIVDSDLLVEKILKALDLNPFLVGRVVIELNPHAPIDVRVDMYADERISQIDIDKYRAIETP